MKTFTTPTFGDKPSYGGFNYDNWPMHNHFLGLVKLLIHTWKEVKILQITQFAKIQEKIDSINPPPKVGRIPRKIESGFAAFTADEWKNFILIYSTLLLKI